MSFTYNIILNTYSIMLLTIIYFHALKQTNKNFFPDNLYMKMLIATISMLVIDIFSRFDGNPGTIYSGFNYVGNFLIFLLHPILPSLWLLYVHYQVFHKEKKIRWVKNLLVTVFGMNAVLLVLSQFFGWFYFIDSQNIYHRGPFFWLPTAFTITLILVTFIIIIANRKKIEKKS